MAQEAREKSLKRENKVSMNKSGENFFFLKNVKQGKEQN
jgi:hypothetical protein